MKSLNKYIKEKLVVNRNYNTVKYYPTTWDELRQIIEERYKELGPGTKKNPIDFNDIDVSGMTTFYDKTKDKGIFKETKFEYIDVSDWDVSRVENMCKMFMNCKKLESIGDISNWDVSSVEDMNSMFYACNELQSIGDISNWDVSSVKIKMFMFIGSGIKNIPSWY